MTGFTTRPTLRVRISRGVKGDTGDTGTTPDFEIGTVTTVAPGGPATATITGTAENPVLNLGIPEGEQGEQGIQGIQGIQGPAGSLDVSVLSQVTPEAGDKVVIGDISDSDNTKYSTATQIFAAGKTAASDTATGVVELATDAETQTGTDTARAITPANLTARTATETRTGIVELATDAETQTGTDTARAITPANLAARTATDTRTGVVELATTAEALTGTDTARAVTPAGLAAATLMQGKHTIWIPASAMKARVTNGCGSSDYDSGSNDITIATLDFDTTTQEYAHTIPIGMPKSWNEGTVTAQAYWTNTGGSSTQTVRFTVAGLAISDDDTLNGTFGTAVNLDDTYLAQNNLHITAESSAITIGGTPAENDLVIFQVSRDVANDNMSGDARLIGIKIFVTINGATDA